MPRERIAAFEPLTAGVKRFQDGNYQAALASLQQSGRREDGARRLRDLLHRPRAVAARPGRRRAAELRRVIDRKAPGYVSIAAGLASGEAAELAGDYAGAVKSTNASPTRRPRSTRTCCRASAARRSPPAIGRKPRRHSFASTTNSL